jgi:glutamate/tyrosine decarboxylase-like PLP-dependent enzyme
MSTESQLDGLRCRVAEPLPHPDAATLYQLSHNVADWVAGHWVNLAGLPVGRTATRAEMEALLRQPPPEIGRPFEAILADFQGKIAANALSTKHPRFLAFVPGAPCFPSVLGDWLSSGTNFFAAVWKEAPGPTQVEIVVLDWFKQFLGYPAGASGLLTTGGSEANLIALAVAREPLSFEDRARAVLYVTEHRHWSIDRAAKILGLRPEQLHPVPAHADYRLNQAHLRTAIAADRAAGRLPWAIVANAGATNTGSVDPLTDLAGICERQGLWFHVDAAYGWPVCLTEEGTKLLAGIERADSITLDPHKWFAQTFEAGCLLVRQGHLLTETFALRPEYMQDVEPSHDEINFADHGIALTRRFKALKIWLSVQMLGMGWFRRLVEHCCDLADYSEAKLKALPTFEILNARRLSIVAFRYLPPGPRPDEAHLDRINLALVEALLAGGRAFVSSTRLRGQVALRFCFVNWRTTAADVDAIIDLLQTLGTSLV